MVRLSLQFSERLLEALAIVRHSRSARSGFEFLDLSPAQQQQLEDRLRTLKGAFLAVAAGVGESGFYAKRFPLL